ncbi:MAG: GMC family oxidoreductase N-terminal domain-containing protein, partial [Gemmatimonadaceae bacterium]
QSSAILTPDPRFQTPIPDPEIPISASRSLIALCRTIVPLDSAAGLATAVERRLAAGDPLLARRVAALLWVFDHPVTAFFTAGRLARFSSMPAADREATLGAWEVSRWPIRRTMLQALRRLVLSTWYATPEGLRDIGWREPLHTRRPELAWEGPLPGPTSDSDPVRRIGESPAVIAEPDEPLVPEGITRGREIPPDTVVRAGICVIGTGAGGAVAAARLAEGGHDVVMLEEGRWWSSRDFTEREAEMMPRLYAESGTRATEDLSIPILQGVAAGGSALVNWLVMLRTPDWVLDEWTREHGAEGMSAADMAPVFDLIEKETHTRCAPDDAHSPSNRALLDGARALGWRARAAAINARGCVRAGTCGLGCRYGAKQGPATVYIPRALRAGARLLTEVRVERIETTGGGAAPLNRVHAVLLDGETGAERGRLTIEAPVVMLAAGAVGTPAILMRSGIGGEAVGRYLRLHPTTAVVGVYDREMYAAAGLPLSSVCDEFHRGSDGYGFWMECPPLYPAFASTALPGFGEAHRARMLQFSRLGPIIVLVRDGARRGLSSGTVTLDRRGRPVIRYRVADADRRTLARGVQAAARLQLAAGAAEAFTLHARGGRVSSEKDIAALVRLDYGPNRLAMYSAHVNGTCRFGTNPRKSVCTPDGGVRGVPGLYVADGSLLPTAPGVNPQETIMALATVIARRIGMS